VRFAQALLDGKLLKPATLEETWTATAVSGKESYGLGFALPEHGKFVMHSGGQPGSSTELLIIPQEHFALAVLANMDGVQIRDLVRALLEEMKLPVPAQP